MKKKKKNRTGTSSGSQDYFETTTSDSDGQILGVTDSCGSTFWRVITQIEFGMGFFFSPISSESACGYNCRGRIHQHHYIPKQ